MIRRSFAIVPMRETMLVALATAVLAGSVVAQAPSRRPGPEQTRIGYFAGRWIVAGEYKASALGPGGKYQGSETCEWFSGGFHLVCRSEGNGPMGLGTGLSIMSYDPAERTYTYHAINSFGDGFFVSGTVNGRVWTFNSEQKVDDKPIKTRVTLTEQSRTSYTFRMETSGDGGPWMVIDEAKGTKIGD
jgi:Protein of unknown function (DUF1579)